MSEQQEKKRITPQNLINALLIVILMQLGALAIMQVNYDSFVVIVSSSGYSFDPAGLVVGGPLINAVLLVLFAFGATLGLLWVVRRRMVHSFKLAIFGSISISAFSLTWITAGDAVEGIVPAELQIPVVIIVPSLVVGLIGYTIFVKNRPILSSVVLAFVGAEVGAFFAGTLSLWTALALPIVFSLYDIYAVFKGPLKHLIGTAPGLALTGMSVKLGEFTLGLGDVVFYTMLPALALFLAKSTTPISAIAPLATMAAVDVGVITTLYLLGRKRLLPGLPIPMFLGVAVLAVFLL